MVGGVVFSGVAVRDVELGDELLDKEVSLECILSNSTDSLTAHFWQMSKLRVVFEISASFNNAVNKRGILFSGSG